MVLKVLNPEETCMLVFRLVLFVFGVLAGCGFGLGFAENKLVLTVASFAGAVVAGLAFYATLP